MIPLSYICFYIHDPTHSLRIHGSRTDHQVHSGVVKFELWPKDGVYIDIGSREPLFRE